MFAALVIVLMQFAAQVHATGHPFHQEDALCAPLISAEIDKHYYHGATYLHDAFAYTSDFKTTSTGQVSLPVQSGYYSRAPPVSAIY